MQSLLILVAPALFAASIYMVFGRIIVLLDAQTYSIIKPKWLTKVFVIGDIFSFFVQSGGAGIQAKGDLDSFNMGANIVIGGLIIQIVIFGFFVVVAMLFHLRLRKNPTVAACDPGLNWQKHLYVLYFTSAIILIRNLIRVIEYSQGNDGYIISNEWMLYIFDAFFIFLVVSAFFLVHPNKLLGARRYAAAAPNDSESFMMTTGEQPVRSDLHHESKR